jgi:hypothetical protein
MVRKVNTSRFYGQWAGHPLSGISTFHQIIQSQRPDKPIVYLAGDSSLDNKYWVPITGPDYEPPPVEVPEIYNTVLDRPYPRPDVAFWLNHVLGDSATTLNLAVEATMLRDRDKDLLDHDKFIRDNISANDVLIVSVGANDIAMRPKIGTALRMVLLVWLTSIPSLSKGTAWGMSYFKNLFHKQVQAYLSRLVEKQKPRAVVVCMIYYPLEVSGPGEKGWADLPLRLLGYGHSPERLQAAIRAIYNFATKKIQINGTEVVPCALFEVLDGKNDEDYTARVEPSKDGGRKMALRFKEIISQLLSKPLENT